MIIGKVSTTTATQLNTYYRNKENLYNLYRIYYNIMKNKKREREKKKQMRITK